ncbi:MAG TPA: hypothetical protein VFQ61_24700 [Polyangiaceae bacterium]|nr:hypothetical protein [Polyangiaceae bacterium]
MLAARQTAPAELPCSLDLGLSEVTASLESEGVRLPGGAFVTWAQLEHVRDHENACFELQDDELHVIRCYSEEFRRDYRLMPTTRAPALLISGFVMHRIRDTTPAEGAHAMVHSLLPVRGRLLDTATGLGYAAVEAARHASEVVTIELDPSVQEVARRNPWSRELFENPKITLRIGNSAELICGLAEGEFSAILHDPPAINLAGDLYSEEFYVHARRVLGRAGKMFHYIGDADSASGSRTTRGVVRRLKSAGFSKVIPKPAAFGVLAIK